MKNTGEMKVKKGRKTGHGLGSSVSLSAVGLLIMLFLPWLVYQNGAGAVWIAIGAYIGIVLVWQLFSYRLMRFSLQQEGVVTLPGFFHQRFMEKLPIFRTFLALVLVGLLLFAATALLYGLGSYAKTIFKIDPWIVKTGILVLSFVLFLVMGRKGFRLADRWLAFVVLGALILINLSILRLLGGEGVLKNIFFSWASGSVSEYVNAEYYGGQSLTVSQHVSMLSFGLLILGSPLVLQRLQQAENGKTVQVSRRWGIIFSLLSLFCAIFAGGMLRAALYPAKINSMEDFFHQLFLEVPKSGIVFYTTCLLFLVTAALVVFEVVHSCMLQASQILHDDLLSPLTEFAKRRLPKRPEGEKTLSKNATLKIFAIIAYLGVGVTAIIAEEGIYGVVLEAVIIVASGLAPVTLLALHCGRMNLAGTWAGFFCGCTVAAVWDLLAVFSKNGQSETLKEILGFHGIIPAMALGLLFGFVVAKITKAPKQEILEAYDQVKYRYVTSDEDWLAESQEKMRRIFRRNEK